MKTAEEAWTKNIYDSNVKILTVLDTKDDLPDHVLVRRLDEGMEYEGTYTGKTYQVPALAIGTTLGNLAYGSQKKSDWLIGFAIERRWLLTIAWHCLVEAIRGQLCRLRKGGQGEKCYDSA